MTAAPWIKHVRLAACAGTLALSAVATCAGNAAWAQAANEDDEEYNSILNTDKRMVDKLLGTLGLISTTPDINYRERSPLVVPSGRDLPPPGAQAAKNPDWPVDPEIKAKRDAAAARKAGLAKVPVDPAKPIAGTSEMYRTGDTGKWDESGKKNTKEPDFFDMLRTGKLLQMKKDEVGTFKGEPPRTSLVEPPPGYLTPSPAAPYGVTDRPQGPEKKEPKL
jgi:hypothetical protein